MIGGLERSNSVWSLRRVTEGRLKEAFAGVIKGGELQVVQIPGSPGSRPGRLPGLVAQVIPGLFSGHVKQPTSEPGPSVSQQGVRDPDNVPRASLELHVVSGRRCRPGPTESAGLGPKCQPGPQACFGSQNPSQPGPQACLGSEASSESVDRVSGPAADLMRN